ncbi:hypothetical protein O9H85_35665 [Paenibacillus filicis]|uniref:Uncharacterized protein n=1 Tax=Paenibacillus gyeongsangnamensis TaxID=3388067 RepID=A0ABT4QLJ8_9BACL|nr:hypothetical protein [Paenibacillus filicis]MCZ8517581.1 hypothetical protein [Paenibacillus filicis]
MTLLRDSDKQAGARLLADTLWERLLERDETEAEFFLRQTLRRLETPGFKPLFGRICFLSAKEALWASAAGLGLGLFGWAVFLWASLVLE